MRDAFSDALVTAAKKDPKILLLTGDHGYALFDAFRKSCPEQYMNCGIAEQNMVGVAAGLAKAGFKPIVYGLASFVPIRVLEQIKIDVCYENLPVTFIGDGAGVVYAQLGTSHQSTEDIAALRAVPQIAIYSPGDRFELTACAEYIVGHPGPAYLRMGKADLGDVHTGPIAGWKNGDLIEITKTGAPYLFIGTGAGLKWPNARPTQSDMRMWSRRRASSPSLPNNCAQSRRIEKPLSRSRNTRFMAASAARSRKR